MTAGGQVGVPLQANRQFLVKVVGPLGRDGSMGGSHGVGGVSWHLGGVAPHVHVHGAAVRVGVHVTTVTGMDVDAEMVALGANGRHVSGGIQGLVVSQVSLVLVEGRETMLLWVVSRSN